MKAELKERLSTKIEEGEFEVSDIPAFLDLFCQLGNEVEDLQDEVEDWNRRLMFVLDGLGTYVITVQDGHFSLHEGMVDNVQFVLKMAAAEAAQVFAGDKDAATAYMNGDLVIEGELPDAILVQTLIEMVIEEIEY